VTTDLFESVDDIDNKDKFLAFMKLLIDYFKINGEKWENKDLLSFFEAASAWVDDMDVFYVRRGREMPKNVDWRAFADILCAATMYE
jgi:hypothetical protein